MKIKIEYTGGLNEKFENKLIKFFKKEGFDNVSSGFDFPTQTRDIEFESSSVSTKKDGTEKTIK